MYTCKFVHIHILICLQLIKSFVVKMIIVIYFCYVIARKVVTKIIYLIPIWCLGDDRGKEIVATSEDVKEQRPIAPDVKQDDVIEEGPGVTLQDQERSSTPPLPPMALAYVASLPANCSLYLEVPLYVYLSE